MYVLKRRFGLSVSRPEVSVWSSIGLFSVLSWPIWMLIKFKSSFVIYPWMFYLFNLGTFKESLNPISWAFILSLGWNFHWIVFVFCPPWGFWCHPLPSETFFPSGPEIWSIPIFLCYIVRFETAGIAEYWFCWILRMNYVTGTAVIKTIVILLYN